MGSCFNHFQEVVNLADELATRRYQRQISASQSKSHNKKAPEVCTPGLELQGVDESFVEVHELMAERFDEPMEIDDQVQVQDDISRGRFVEVYEGSAESYGAGTTFMGQFDYDRFAAERMDNLYYPFASRDEWQLASFLLGSGLSMQAMNTFLSLNLVRPQLYWKHG